MGDGLGDKPVSFRVTADGGVKAGHDTSHPFMATAKNDVVTKAYTDEHTLQPDKSNDITTGFRIKCDNQTFLSAAGGDKLGLYHLKEPQDVSHAATKAPCGASTTLFKQRLSLSLRWWRPTTKYDGTKTVTARSGYQHDNP